MNKVHRLKLLFISKILRLCKFLSNEKYREISTYYFRECGVVFHGIPKYINYDVDLDLTKPGLIHVGNNTVITKGTTLLTHDYSIECGLVAINKNNPDYEMQFLKEIHIGNDCFIGYKSIILPGAKIGDNCIIGSGSVVSGTVENNSVIAGNPARFICHTTEWAERKFMEKQFVEGTPNKSKQRCK